MPIFHILAGGRMFRITQNGALVDCRDTRTGDESQAIIDAHAAQNTTNVLADSQVRDAIASAYYNATCRESGKYPLGGTSLPDGFEITLG